MDPVELLEPRMRWWGWGRDGHDPEITPPLEALLREELEAPAADLPPAALEDVALPGTALPEAVLDRLVAITGYGHVRDDRLSRVSHAAGRSYPDLVRLRGGDASFAPDAVVYPGTPAEVAGVLEACSQLGVAVVPFGGGTSVVGGVEALRGPFDHVVSLDLARLCSLLAVDAEALTATVEAGTTGPALEAALAQHGLTLGHFPQSFEYSTVGGWAATRSAGQNSTGYGRIDENVIGLRAAAPAGGIAARDLPATAAGPDLRQLLLGSEGALAVITDVTLRVRPAPASRRYEAFAFSSFAEGCEALRMLRQGGAAPDVSRLSDEHETRMSLALAGESAATRMLGRYLRLRGQGSPCLMIAGFEGEGETVTRRRDAAAKLLKRQGAVSLGARPGAAWAHGRFLGPYLRDVLLGRGIFVDTLETAATWDRIPSLYAAVQAAIAGALAGRGTPAFVACHVSHLYATGCSLYFTFAARREQGAELAQWHAAKQAAGDAIIAAGGTITHHHAIGRDHAPWLAGEIGSLGVDLIRAAKERLDPAGILNPGKLVDGAALPGA